MAKVGIVRGDFETCKLRFNQHRSAIKKHFKVSIEIPASGSKTDSSVPFQGSTKAKAGNTEVSFTDYENLITTIKEVGTCGLPGPDYRKPIKLFGDLVFILPYYSDESCLDVVESNIRIMIGDLLSKISCNMIAQLDNVSKYSINETELIIVQNSILNDIRELWIGGAILSAEQLHERIFDANQQVFRKFPGYRATETLSWKADDSTSQSMDIEFLSVGERNNIQF